jgi:hypothetical protein
MANLRTDQAARYLQEQSGGAYTPSTLTTYRCRGGGPRYRLLSRFPVYSTDDLDAWLAERTSEPVTRNAELGA